VYLSSEAECIRQEVPNHRLLRGASLASLKRLCTLEGEGKVCQLGFVAILHKPRPACFSSSGKGDVVLPELCSTLRVVLSRVSMCMRVLEGMDSAQPGQPAMGWGHPRKTRDKKSPTNKRILEAIRFEHASHSSSGNKSTLRRSGCRVFKLMLMLRLSWSLRVAASLAKRSCRAAIQKQEDGQGADGENHLDGCQPCSWPRHHLAAIYTRKWVTGEWETGTTASHSQCQMTPTMADLHENWKPGGQTTTDPDPRPSSTQPRKTGS
jgi:hypothetical protein